MKGAIICKRSTGISEAQQVCNLVEVEVLGMKKSKERVCAEIAN